MTDQYYIKKGRRYIPIDRFDGFPADGIWLVERTKGGHKEKLMIQLADTQKVTSVEKIVAEVVTAEIIKEAVLTVFDKLNKLNKSFSYNDIAKMAAQEVSCLTGSQTDNQELLQ